MAVATHTHMDHIGSLYEFDQRLVHPLEAEQLRHPDDYPVLCSCHWPTGMREAIESQGYEVPDLLVDAYPYEGFDPLTFASEVSSSQKIYGETGAKAARPG